MGDFLHQRLYLNDGDIVEVMCDTQANVMLMSDLDFSSYQRGAAFHYHGGLFKYFPARLAPPHSGDWNVVLDLGGGTGTIRHSMRIIHAGGWLGTSLFYRHLQGRHHILDLVGIAHACAMPARVGLTVLPDCSIFSRNRHKEIAHFCS